MPDETLVLTLIDPHGTRRPPSRAVTAAADEPHGLLPHFLQMVADEQSTRTSAGEVVDGPYEVEVALPGTNTSAGQVLYLLRCLDTESS